MSRLRRPSGMSWRGRHAGNGARLPRGNRRQPGDGLRGVGLWRLAPLLVLLPITALLGGCTRHLGPDEWPIHQRVLLSTDAGTLEVVELVHPDGMAPTVTLATVAIDGSPGETRALPPREAARIASEVRGGSRLEVALGAISRSASLQNGWDPDGLSPAPAPESIDVRVPPPDLAPEPDETPGLPRPIRWSETLSVDSHAGSQRSLGARQVDDPRYGSRLVVEIRGERLSSPLLILPARATVRFTGTESESAWFAWEIGAGANRLRDVRRIDLLQAEAGLQRRIADRSLENGEEAAAIGALELAESLKPADPGVAYARAMLAARTGAAIEDMLPWLERAIAADPPLYRMRARTQPVFARYRNEPRFRELVAPAPLQGTQRVTASPPAPPSATPDR